MNNYFASVKLSVTLAILLLLQSCAVDRQILPKKTFNKFKEVLFQTTINLSDRGLNNSQELSSIEEVPEPKNTLAVLTRLDIDKSKRLANTAKILAGIAIDSNSSLGELQTQKSWQEHHLSISKSWSQLEAQQLTKMSQWSETELAQINASSQTVFYPFSGGDFLQVYTLLPQSKEFILMGSEPIGEIPEIANLDRYRLDNRLESVRNSLYNILEFDFLKTKNFDKELPEKSVLDTLYVFLARTNNKIIDISYIALDRSGNIRPPTNDLDVSGVKITFIAPNDTISREVYYIQASLADEELEDRPETLKFIEKRAKIITYLHKASYLMHYDSFSTIRNLILARSNYLLQDDSGIPLEFLDRTHWQLKFYGNYTQPIALFRDRYQANLRQIYLSNTELKPLSFSVGYQLNPAESNLMLGKLSNKY
jgi:hypothetical protein